MNLLFQRAALLFLLILASAVPGNAITFNNTWDPSISTYLPAADVPKFQAAVIYAEQQFQNAFTDAITINITFKVRRGTGTLGGSLATFLATTYPEVKAALTASAVSAVDHSSVASLPANDPAGLGGWSLPSAEAKALGLLAPNNPASDGTIYFGSGYAYTYDPANRKVAGTYDLIGIALHEISEVMGRNSNVDSFPSGGAPFDLFRYTAAGVRSLDPNAVNVYFSADGGITKLHYFNSLSSGDIMDWAGPDPDAFNAFGPTNEQDDLTPWDITAMDVIGYTPANFTIAGSAIPAAGGSVSGGGRIVSGASVTLTATPAAGYSFVNWTEGGVQASAAASYTFTAGANRTLVANFILNATNANLSSIAPGAGGLSPAFASGTLNYTANVARSAFYYTVTPTVAQTGATVTVNGTALASGTASGHIPLTIGSSNVITIAVTAPVGGPPQTYTITVTRASRETPGDLSGDGIADILFQNTAGQIATWVMNGAGAPVSSQSIYAGSLGDWKVAAVADMDNDGNSDIIFQNSYGQIVVWYMNGAGGLLSAGTIYAGNLGDWKVVAVADMNNDGKSDILFQNSYGQIAVWYMNGAGGLLSAGTIYAGSLGDWKVVAVADMNNDGKADIIFQNSYGQTVVWYMNGAGTPTSSGVIYAGSLSGWKVVAVADMNNDGNADILFQNSYGQIVVWYMNGAGAPTSSGTIYAGSLGDWMVR